MNKCKEIGTPMETKLTILKNEQMTTKPYTELIGCLMYLGTLSRTDISYTIIFLSRSQSKPSNTHCMYLKRILRYLKGTCNLCLTFSRIECDILAGFCDADFAGNLKDRRSNTGYVFKVLSSAVSWCSRK